MRIELPFAPVACPRPRIAMRGGYPTAYYPPKYKAFKQDVKAYLEKHYPDVKYDEGPLHVSYDFIFPRPKSLFRKKDLDKRIKHTKKPDLDNLVKSVNDVLEDAGILSNDSIVQTITASKYTASKTGRAEIIVVINHG